MRRFCLPSIWLIAFLGGCNSLQHQGQVAAEGDSKRPTTILEWNVPKKEDKKGDENPGDEKKPNDKNAKNTQDDEKEGEEKKKGDDKQGGGTADQAKEDEPKHQRIDPDRPHLPEASTTVGLGNIVLESGFTYNTSAGYFNRYSFPEALLRVGVFYDWLELRIAENVQGETLGPKSTLFGATDLQIGAKIALTEQKDWLPEAALLLQMTVPSGSPGFSANRVLPGVHLNLGWEIVKEKLAVEVVLLADGTVDNFGHTYTLMGDGVTLVYDVTKKLEFFCELDSYYSIGESAGPQNYFVGGFVYFFNNNFEIDIRSGVGLNQHANGYLLGAGFAYRF